MEAQKYLDNHNKHDLATKCMQKDKRIEELKEFCRLVSNSYKLINDEKGFKQIHYSLSVKAKELLEK